MTHQPEAQVDAPAKPSGAGESHLAAMQKDTQPASVGEAKGLQASNESAKGDSAAQHLPSFSIADNNNPGDGGARGPGSDPKNSDKADTGAAPNPDKQQEAQPNREDYFQRFPYAKEAKPADTVSGNDSQDQGVKGDQGPQSQGPNGGDNNPGSAWTTRSNHGLRNPAISEISKADSVSDSSSASGARAQGSDAQKSGPPPANRLSESPDAIHKRIDASYDTIKKMSHVAPASIMK